MFDLDLAVGEWRGRMARSRVLTRDDLDELEDHLRAAYDLEMHLTPALTPADAFDRARALIGGAETLAGEFAKVGGRVWRKLLHGAWAVFGVSWLLPVHRHGITVLDLDLSEGLLPGIQALHVAMSDPSQPVGLLSGLTNLIVLATLWRIGDAGRSRVAALSALLFAGAVLNGWWFASSEPRGDLLAGYYAWVSSFALAGAGLALRARTLPASEPDRLAAAPE